METPVTQQLKEENATLRERVRELEARSETWERRARLLADHVVGNVDFAIDWDASDGDRLAVDLTLEWPATSVDGPPPIRIEESGDDSFWKAVDRADEAHNRGTVPCTDSPAKPAEGEET